MRTFLRTLAATAALSALLLGAGASTALAASDQASPAQTYKYVFNDEWCFDYGVTYDCSVADGVVSATYAPGGREVVRIHYKLTVDSFAADGTPIGSSRMGSFDRWITSENGQSSVFTVEHHKASGAGYDCTYGYHLKIVDYEVVVDRYTGPGCN